jgi:cytochrome c biogenesis protein CcmG, thiol:disulfide interchange protein DsbE
VKQTLDQILVGVILALSGALIWVVSGTLEQHIVAVGDKSPAFAVVTESGKKITPSSFGGKLLIVNFWASWCPPCIEETPSMNEFIKEYGQKGVVLLGVSVDRNETLYKRFLEKMKVGFDTYRDPEADIGASFGTFQYPETYVIDSSGKVVKKIIGVVGTRHWQDPDFLADIQKLL